MPPGSDSFFALSPVPFGAPDKNSPGFQLPPASQSRAHCAKNDPLKSCILEISEDIYIYIFLKLKELNRDRPTKHFTELSQDTWYDPSAFSPKTIG